jgi:glutathione S-transferase
VGHRLQLTIADLVDEIHDTHHPLGTSLYYEDQRPAAKRRAREFWHARVPKFPGYFERLDRRAAARISMAAGLLCGSVPVSDYRGSALRFSQPHETLERKVPNLIALHDKVAARPNIKAYLASERRIPFNEDGIFRHYPVLDR